MVEKSPIISEGDLPTTDIIEPFLTESKPIQTGEYVNSSVF